MWAVGGATGQALGHFLGCEHSQETGVLWELQDALWQPPGGLPAGKGGAVGRWGHLEPGMGVTQDTVVFSRKRCR